MRTLLLNADGDAVVPDWAIGEEPVDAAYRAVAVPAWLAAVRARLFGSAPDRSWMNYRLAQYVTLLHRTELEQHVLAPDPRVTYLPPPAGDGGRAVLDFFPAGHFTPHAAPVTPGAPALAVQGRPLAADATGRGYHEYDLTVTASTVQVRQNHPAGRAAGVVVETDYELSAGLSAPVPLGDGGCSVLLEAVPPGTTWRVAYHVRPAVDPGSVLAGLRQLDEPTLLRLFGASPVEPYRTFADLFRHHVELAYGLGGLLLAVAYRTDELRGA